jgi:dolichol-phosphate mannosyltransferase
MRLSVIAPTLNEAGNIPRLVEQLEHALAGIDYEILIVDDNSSDLTWSVAKEISLTNPRVRALCRMQNHGLGLAVIDGFCAADGDVLACIDADLQHDPSILPRMLNELQNGADIVVGSRHIEGGSTGEWGWFRRLESKLATRAAQFLLGIRLKDPMSGYFMVWQEDFYQVRDMLNGKGFKILLEFLARLHGSQVKEIPYTFRLRTSGESKLSNRVIFLYLQQLWRLCSASRHRSVRFLKSAVVGSAGVFINLAIMALLLWLTKIQDWRASALASLATNGQNYLLNHFWIYPEQPHGRLWRLRGYLSYLLTSAAGLAVTTVFYALLIDGVAPSSLVQSAAGATASLTRLACQLVAVLMGVWFNYASNRLFAWPDLMRMNLEGPDSTYEHGAISNRDPEIEQSGDDSKAISVLPSTVIQRSKD